MICTVRVQRFPTQAIPSYPLIIPWCNRWHFCFVHILRGIVGGRGQFTLYKGYRLRVPKLVANITEDPRWKIPHESKLNAFNTSASPLLDTSREEPCSNSDFECEACCFDGAVWFRMDVAKCCNQPMQLQCCNPPSAKKIATNIVCRSVPTSLDVLVEKVVNKGEKIILMMLLFTFI